MIKAKRFKMIFSDVDGTILNSNHQVSDEAKSKILDLHSVNIPFVMVSGRMPKGIELVQRSIGIKAPMICFSGALSLNEHREVIASNTIRQKDALEFCTYVKNQFPEICCNAYYTDDWIVTDRQHPSIIIEENIVKTRSKQLDLMKYLSQVQGIHKFLLIGSEPVIQEASRHLQNKFSNLTVVKSTPIYLEIMDGKTNKAKAVRALCHYYGVDTDEVLAFGDGMNDLELLSIIENSYAMGNAAEEVKRAARYITETNDNNGLLKVLNNIFD